ncbi:MAG: VWA domain-containing protein [Tissierellales bacterium]|jgi:uncharacterized membrane protein|nr:VWA domain-containing protein [Tissierellales bacterium]
MIANALMILGALIVIFMIIVDASKKNIPMLHSISRAVLIVLVLLAGLNIKWMSKSEKVPVYFAVDQSYSQKYNRVSIEEALENMIEKLPQDQPYKIVSFGSDSIVAMNKTGDFEGIDLSQINVNESSTNYENVINMISSELEDELGANIVILSDGVENEGDVLRTIQKLKIKKANVYWLPYEIAIKKDVQISDIVGPNRIFENQDYKLSVLVESNYDTEGFLKIYVNDELIEEQLVKIPEGNSVLTREFDSNKIGQNVIEAVIEVDDDEQVINNKYRKIIQIDGKAQVLLIKDNENDLKQFEKLLNENEIGVDIKTPEKLSLELNSLLNYNAVIFEDVSLENLNKKFLDNLETYLRDYGGGLLVSGGKNSYALGGYYKTKLEELLPVSMEKKQKNILEKMGLVIVIDQSGSMMGDSLGKSKIEVAKEASAKAINSMMPGDQIGILSFSDSRKWVVPVGDIQDAKEIKRKIRTIDAEGGTSIIPALKSAYESLKDSNVQHKHIILVTDGQAEQDGYREVLKNLKDEKITLTTLGIGQGADNRLLNFLARNAGGRFYKVDNYLNLPEIFTKETAMMADRYLNNRVFYPNIVSANEIVSGLIEEPLLLNGYVSTTIKPRASLIMESDEEEPVLAYWNYGIGNVYAWTSDFDGMWNEQYLKAENGRIFYLKLINEVLKKNQQKLEFDEKSMGLNHKIIVYRQSDEEDYEFKLIDQSGQEYPIMTKKSVDGWEIEFKKGDGYIYSLIARDKENKTIDYNFVTQYSKEYDWTIRNEDNFRFYLSQIGGEELKSSDEFESKEQFRKTEYKELWRYFLVIFLILLLVDVYIRKTDKRKIYERQNKEEIADLELKNQDVNSETDLDIDKLIRNKNKKV